MELKPSEIYYSQDSISNAFRHTYELIGETLDDICEDRCSIYSIPTISVMRKNGRWITSDNRRLWVFRQLERLGKCDTVPVYVTDQIPPEKMTSLNGGDAVRVRGNPGGSWHLKPKPVVNQRYTSYPRYSVQPKPKPVVYPTPESVYTPRRETNYGTEAMHTQYRPVQEENSERSLCTIL
ncbi:hypothetical protein MAR_003307 [Mya arenaria]|uniref:Uncharacterized protein n=1 Tax=Mya arenaria TaxID=6604 RepID=A0ABY7G8N6_MYAAR|nr:uncharacterized protein LOC128222356 [Mya arenaria]WAR29739.1 hypothetical protein MAR_003307 [Mya arenaria]